MNALLEERLRLAFPPRRPLTVKGAAPGEEISFDDHGATRTATVVDRAELVTYKPAWSRTRGAYDIAEIVPGTFLWVIPDDGRSDSHGCVMVQTWQTGRNVGRFVRVDPQDCRARLAS